MDHYVDDGFNPFTTQIIFPHCFQVFNFSIVPHYFPKNAATSIIVSHFSQRCYYFNKYPALLKIFFILLLFRTIF